MRNLLTGLFLAVALNAALSQQLQISRTHSGYLLSVVQKDKTMLQSPVEGLWSISTEWRDNWPYNWQHIQPSRIDTTGEWLIVEGSLPLPQGAWFVRDAYREEDGRIRCLRRWEWRGDQTLDQVTLSVRWLVPTADSRPFLPGILYYGNPSGYKNGSGNVAWYQSKPGDIAIFEEHRYPMPFASAEWQQGGVACGAALHSVPSPVYGGNLYDQWWSLGLTTTYNNTELTLLSGPVGYNRQQGQVKALQDKPMPYQDTWMKVRPGTVIEKTYYLETGTAPAPGTAFQQPVHTSVALFKPFYAEDLPTFDEIIRLKYRFMKSRWIEDLDYAGFNMYPPQYAPKIVMGWAGQCEAPGYALQSLAARLSDQKLTEMVQRSLDHLCTSPFDQSGFCVTYDPLTNEWTDKDAVSQGQAMYSMALAIREGRKNPKMNTQSWEKFLRKACDIFSDRLLSKTWNPVNTSEAFFIAPLLEANRLFREKKYREAALKAADYYISRHGDMKEPYWGGTLDATCEDKEGAWGAFQGFLSAYEATKDARYLKAAQHACDVVLSYTVVWDIPMPAGRLADHALKTRGWTGVSAQNQHLDVYGVVMAPSIYKTGSYLKDESLKRLAIVMYRSCGQMISPTGAHGEQIQETNFAQHGDMSDVLKLRGGYSESWTVFWITAHFLHAAAQFEEMGVR